MTTARFTNEVTGWQVQVPPGWLYPVEVIPLTGPITADKALARVTIGEHTYQHSGYTVGQALQRLSEKIVMAGLRVWFLAPGEKP